MGKIRKIGENSYEEDVTCFKVGGKWRAIDDPEIAFDTRINKWALKKNLMFGYIDKNLNKGHFSPGFHTIESEVGPYMDLRDCPLSLGKDYTKSFNGRKLEIIHPWPLVYSFSDDAAYIDKIQHTFNSDHKPVYPVGLPAKMLGKALGGYTYGLEYETSNGTIPTVCLGKHALVPLKDGSLRKANGKEPMEYVSLPLSGGLGVQVIADQTYLLQNYCEYDTNCSLHLHIGNLRQDRLFLVALYELCYSLQQELYDLVPLYKRDPAYFLGATLQNGDARKNYARLLPGLTGSVNERYGQIFSLVSDGYYFGGPESATRYMQHKQNKKWNHKNRYYCVNFEHMLLGNVGTVEFRIRHMTFSFAHVINWVLLCTAIVKYAEEHAAQIVYKNLRPTLTEVVKIYAKSCFGKSAATCLTNYVENTKRNNLENMSVGSIEPAEVYANSYGVTSNLLTHPDAMMPERPKQATASIPDYETYLAELKQNADKWKAMDLNPIDQPVVAAMAQLVEQAPIPAPEDEEEFWDDDWAEEEEHEEKVAEAQKVKAELF